MRRSRSLKMEELKTDPIEERKPDPITNSTETLEFKLDGFIKVKDMKSLLKKESDNQAVDDGFSQKGKNMEKKQDEDQTYFEVRTKYLIQN